MRILSQTEGGKQIGIKRIMQMNVEYVFRIEEILR